MLILAKVKNLVYPVILQLILGPYPNASRARTISQHTAGQRAGENEGLPSR